LALRFAVHADKHTTHAHMCPQKAAQVLDDMDTSKAEQVLMKMEAKPAQVLDEMDKSKAAEVLKIMNASPSGLKWTNVGEAKPNVGRELSNSKLAKALESKQTWLASKKEDKEEWDKFAIKDLRREDFIKCKDVYYKPASRAAELLNEMNVGKVESLVGKLDPSEAAEMLGILGEIDEQSLKKAADLLTKLDTL